MKQTIFALTAALLLLTGCGADSAFLPDSDSFSTVVVITDGTETASQPALAEDGTYSSAEDVSLYLTEYGHLPDNYITKSEARDLGWAGGSLEPYAPGMCIGGDRFGNYEGLLPAEQTYHECDIDTLRADSRGAKRLVYSDNGDVYYTEDHYNTFTLLYGDDDNE